MPEPNAILDDFVRPKITKWVAGKQVEVPIDEVWDSICKILRIARLLTSPNGETYEATRLAFLAERMSDIEGLDFWYKRHPFGANLDEMFVPVRHSPQHIFNRLDTTNA